MKMASGPGVKSSGFVLLILFLSLKCRASTIYSIQIGKIGTLETRQLRNTQTGRVEELVLMSQKDGNLRKVLLSHNGNASAIIENTWWKGMILLPWANRIAKGQYTFYNGTYQLEVNENTTDPMRVNALHGLLAGKVLKVEKADSSDMSAVIGLSYSFTGDELGYPFLLTVYMEYTLDKNGFKLNYTITNNMGRSPLPFYVGWHPYFACEAYKAILTLDQCGKWAHVELNSNSDPTGITAIYNGFDGTSPIGGTLQNPTFYDDEFKFLKGPNDCSTLDIKLYDPDNGQTVVLWQDSNFRLVHIFTGSASLFGENSVAIEPMSGMADAYNNHDHLSILSGGEVWSGVFGVYVN